MRIQRATVKERPYLRAMAELGSGPYKLGQVAKAMGSTTTALSTVRQKLLDRGLIYATEDYGHVDFTVPPLRRVHAPPYGIHTPIVATTQVAAPAPELESGPRATRTRPPAWKPAPPPRDL